jgi:hypothetical protein
VNLELPESFNFSPYPGSAKQISAMVGQKIKATVQEQRGMAMLIGKASDPSWCNTSSDFREREIERENGSGTQGFHFFALRCWVRHPS